MRNRSVFNRTFNALLDEIARYPLGSMFSTVSEVSRQLNVSRTTAEAVLQKAEDESILSRSGRSRLVVRSPDRSDYFDDGETESMSSAVERRFMDLVLRGGLKPGDIVSGLGLAQELGVSSWSFREYLNRFERFGLVERKPNTSFRFLGFTPEFAVELFEVREMFEIRAVTKIAFNLDAATLGLLDELEAAHKDVLANIETRYHEFSDLDASFHRTLAKAGSNRFFNQFQEIIALIFHYHYQWNKLDERERNEAAIGEHLAIIAAIRIGDLDRILTAMRKHLTSAKATLLRSIHPRD